MFENDGLETVAIHDVNFSTRVSETLALVAESSSGKSSTALSILALVPPPGPIAAGSVFCNGTDLTQLSEEH